MSESFVQLPPDSTGKKLRAILQTINEEEVLEQTIGISVEKTLIDPRVIRALTSADFVSAIKSGVWNIDNLLNPHPVSLTSIPNPPNLDVALSTRATGTLLNPHPISLSTLLNPHPVVASLGTSTGKTNVLVTGNKVTTAATADQVILTYTVTAGKKFYMEYLTISARLTTFAVTATFFGASSLENPAATKLFTIDCAGAGITAPPIVLWFAEPIPIAAGTVIRVVCTPSSATSYTWKANFGGYEK